MMAILAALCLLAVGLTVAIGLGCLLARLEREAESGPRCPPEEPGRPEPVQRTLRDAHSLHARLLRAAIEGPKDEGER